jgi:hypothetical protein
VIERVVDDVLAQTLVTAALHVDDRREAVEFRSLGVELEPLELVALDLEGKVLDLVVAAHGGGPYRPVAAGFRAWRNVAALGGTEAAFMPSEERRRNG